MEMEEWKDELRRIRDKVKPYHCPLPRRKQRVYLRGRSGKVKRYNQDEIENYIRSKSHAASS